MSWRLILGDTCPGVAVGVGEARAKRCWGERWGEVCLVEGRLLVKGWSGKGLWLKLGGLGALKAEWSALKFVLNWEGCRTGLS